MSRGKKIYNKDFPDVLFKPNYKESRQKNKYSENYFKINSTLFDEPKQRTASTKLQDIDNAVEKERRSFDFKRILSQYNEFINSKENKYSPQFIDELTDLLKENDKDYNNQRRSLDIKSNLYSPINVGPTKSKESLFFFYRDLNNKRLIKFKKMNRIKSDKYMLEVEKQNTGGANTNINSGMSTKSKFNTKSSFSPTKDNYRNKSNDKRFILSSEYSTFRTTGVDNFLGKERILEKIDEKYYRYDKDLYYNKRRIFNCLSNENEFYIPKEQLKSCQITCEKLSELLEDPVIDLGHEVMTKNRKKICDRMQKSLSYGNLLIKKYKEKEEEEKKKLSVNLNIKIDEYAKSIEEKNKKELIEMKKIKKLNKIQEKENIQHLTELVSKQIPLPELSKHKSTNSFGQTFSTFDKTGISMFRFKPEIKLFSPNSTNTIFCDKMTTNYK